MVGRAIALAAARELISLKRELERGLALASQLERTEAAASTLAELEAVTAQVGHSAYTLPAPRL